MHLTEAQARSLLCGKVITFNNKIETEFDADFDSGQRALVVDVFDSGDEDVLQLILDFSEFEEYNKALAKPSYYDKNSVPCLRWHETPDYPKDKRYNFYIALDPTNWPFSYEGQGDCPVVLSAQSWNVLIEKIGMEKLDEWGVKPI